MSLGRAARKRAEAEPLVERDGVSDGGEIGCAPSRLLARAALGKRRKAVWDERNNTRKIWSV